MCFSGITETGFEQDFVILCSGKHLKIIKADATKPEVELQGLAGPMGIHLTGPD